MDNAVGNECTEARWREAMWYCHSHSGCLVVSEGMCVTTTGGTAAGCESDRADRGTACGMMVRQMYQNDVTTQRGVKGQAKVTAEGPASVRRNARDQCVSGCQWGAVHRGTIAGNAVVGELTDAHWHVAMGYWHSGSGYQMESKSAWATMTGGTYAGCESDHKDRR